MPHGAFYEVGWHKCHPTFLVASATSGIITVLIVMAHSIKELRELTEDQIIAAHDLAAPSTTSGVSYYLNELHKREQDRFLAEQHEMNRQMLAHTAEMTRMTRLVTVITILTGVMSAISLSLSILSILPRGSVLVATSKPAVLGKPQVVHTNIVPSQSAKSVTAVAKPEVASPSVPAPNPK